MSEEEQHRAELWSSGISVRHPIEFIREELDASGCVPVDRVLGMHRPGRAKVAGVVTHRQRPGTAAGVIFFNLEDETGQLNVIVTPDIWERYRSVARKSPALVIEGQVEYRHGVTNLIAASMEGIGVYTVKSRDFR
jgi:error-prone DNA polymerase